MTDKLAAYRRKRRPSRPMPDDVKAELADNRRRRQAEEAERRAELAARPTANAWRRRRLAGYVDRVLQLSGRSRLAFFESNPISELFPVRRR